MASNKEAKEHFESLIELRGDISSVLDTLRAKQDVLVGIYQDLTTTHRSKDFVFGLDSFFFQNELIQGECKHLSSVFGSIDNRVYCEYLTVYRMMIDYTRNDVKDQRVTGHAAFNQTFTPYKHLENSKVHDVRAIKEIHQAIISCLSELESLLSNREAELRNDKQQSALGLNIDNLVYMEGFKNMMLGGRIEMFYKYLSALNEHHTNYYTRLLLKAKLHMGVVEEDVRLKQFNQSGITNIDRIPGRTQKSASPVAMKAAEESAIKSFIGYDAMPASKKTVLDGLCMASASGSEVGSETEEIDYSINPHINVTRDGIESHYPYEGDAIAVLPEESEIASNVGDIISEFTTSDIGTRVAVEGYDCPGTIRFVGQHHVERSLRCGIELDEAVGRNNGTIRDHKYFECDQLHGVLVIPRKVTRLDGSLSAIDDK